MHALLGCVCQGPSCPKKAAAVVSGKKRLRKKKKRSAKLKKRGLRVLKKRPHMRGGGGGAKITGQERGARVIRQQAKGAVVPVSPVERSACVK